MPRRQAILAASLLAIACHLPALADGAIDKLISQADRQRLQNYDATRESALKDARAGGAARDVATLDAAIREPGRSFQDFDMTGSWNCRVIKAGGLARLVVYDWFDCRVTDDGSGWFLKKVTGSQRTQGRFYTDSDTRLTYLGAFFVAGDPAPTYGADPDSDQVGYAFRTGPETFRIELPAPRYESKLDIIELRR